MAQQFSRIKVPVPYIPIGGTHSWDEDEAHLQWWERGSALESHLSALGLVLHARTPFAWATSLDGVFFERNKTIWKAAANHLVCHLERVPLEERNLLVHSHGGQIVFYACAKGLRINNLVTVGTPVRADLEPVVMAARGNINYWHHICDSRYDFWALMGTLWDGKIRVCHQFPLADTNDDVKGIGHSRILTSDFSGWESRGWASILAYGRKAFL